MNAPQITIDTRQVQALAAVMAAMPKQAPGIIKRTLNFTGNKMRTQVFRSLRDQTGMTYGDISDVIQTYPATDTRLAYTLHGSGEFTTLRHFEPRQVRGGVSARPWGKRRVFRGAFLARSMNDQVMKRVGPRVKIDGKSRQKVEVLYGPNVSREMMRGATPSVATFSVAMDFMPRLSYEFQRALKIALASKIRGALL